jgi:hypothetical protein
VRAQMIAEPPRVEDRDVVIRAGEYHLRQLLCRCKPQLAP